MIYKKLKCTRCGEIIKTGEISTFTTETICANCVKIEKRHPDYKAARAATDAATEAGNFFFPGVGWPVKKKDE
jgi:hypothetical protein